MNGLAKSCLVSLAVFVSQAQAQEAQPAPPDTQTENVNVQMTPPSGPGMPFQMNMTVQHASTSAPAPAPAPSAPAVEMRDCGTGRDPGCEMTRRGQLPMDADELKGFLEAMRGNPNEIDREDIAKSTLSSSNLTAKQLGLVLELFENEIVRFEVAQAAAPKVVNPKHALGLAGKFQNSIYATDFTKLMNAQRDR